MDAHSRHSSGQPLKLFISYSHADEEYLQRLEKHLAPLVHEGEIQVWHDRRITPSHPWEPEIDDHLRSADLVLLLITPDFLASKYCWDVELRLAMARHEAGEARVLPLFVKPTSLRGVPYRHIQGFPRDIQSKPRTIVGWPTGPDDACVAFVEQLMEVIRELREAHPASGASYSRKHYLASFLRRMDELDADACFEPASFIEPEKDIETPSSPTDLAFEVDRDWSEALPKTSGSPVRQTRSPLSQLLRQPRTHRVIALLGEPGSGKSVVLRRLGGELARAALVDSQAALPVWFNLGSYTGTTLQGEPVPLEVYLRVCLETGPVEERGLAGAFEGLLAEGRLVLLFDGLDEMPRRDFARRLEAIRAFTRARGQATMLFACRTRDFPPRSQFDVQQIRLAPFNARRVRAYLRQRGIREPARVAQRLLAPQSPLAEVVGNPFMLALVARHLENHGSLPASRARLLEEFVERQLGRLERKAGPIGRRKVESGLGRLSLGLLERFGAGTAVPVEELLGLSGLEPSEGALLVDAAISERLLQRDADTGAVRFFHPRVQEVFAASALRAMPPEERDAWLTARVDDTWRHELFVLLARPDVDLSRFLARQLDEIEGGLGKGLGDFIYDARLMLLGRMIESAALSRDAPAVVRMGALLARRFQSSNRSAVPVLRRVRALRAARGALVEQRPLTPYVKSALRSPSRWEQSEAFRAVASLAHARPVVRGVLRKQVLSEGLTRDILFERGYWMGLAASDSRLRFLVRSIHQALLLHLLASAAVVGAWGAVLGYFHGATGVWVGVILSVAHQVFVSGLGRLRVGQGSGVLQQGMALGLGAAFFVAWCLPMTLGRALALYGPKDPAWSETPLSSYGERVELGLAGGLGFAVFMLVIELGDFSAFRGMKMRRLWGLGLLLGLVSALSEGTGHPRLDALLLTGMGLGLLGLLFVKRRQLWRLRFKWGRAALMVFLPVGVAILSTAPFLQGEWGAWLTLALIVLFSLRLVVAVLWNRVRAWKRKGFRLSGVNALGLLLRATLVGGMFLVVGVLWGIPGIVVLIPGIVVLGISLRALRWCLTHWSAGRLAAPGEPLSMERMPRVLEVAMDERVLARLRSALVARLGTLEPASEVLALALREMTRVGAPRIDAEVCARAVDDLEQRLLREGPRTREDRLLREVPALYAVLNAFPARRAHRLITGWLAHAGGSRDELSHLESNPQVGTYARELASLLAPEGA